jgi:D-aspartate ligase
MAATSSPIACFPKPELLRQASVPVLALGGGLTLLGVMRSLSAKGMPLYSITEEHDFVTRSRWYRQLPIEPTRNPDALATFLRWLPMERAVLIPCTDEWLRAVSSLPKSLADKFPSSIGPVSVIEAMTDKWRFAQLLELTGVPHPETVFVSSYQEIQALNPEKLRYKILKPLFSARFASRYGVKGYVVRDKTEALQAAASIEYPILLQDYIPGLPTANIFIDGFVDRNGCICAHFVRRRLRMYPPGLGNSSLLISISSSEVEPALQDLDKLLGSIPYRGIFSAEFKYDMRDGRFKLLEINARPWWYVEFASHCGVNVCHMSYCDALELPVTPVSGYKIGRKCVLLPYDLRAFRDKRNGLHLWSWMRSWIGAHGGLFLWRDPMPAVTFGWRISKRALHRYFLKRRSKQPAPSSTTSGKPHN